jgi:hypothetical protein
MPPSKPIIALQYLVISSIFSSNDKFFLNSFDIWLLVSKYEIPTIFISQVKLFLTKDQKNQFVGYTNIDANIDANIDPNIDANIDPETNNKYAFIVVPGRRPDIIPSFKYIQSNEGDIFIDLDILKEDCVIKLQDDIRTRISVKDFLQNYTKKTSKKYERKKLLPLEIEGEFSEDSIPEQLPVVEEEKELPVALVQEEPAVLQGLHWKSLPVHIALLLSRHENDQQLNNKMLQSMKKPINP